VTIGPARQKDRRKPPRQPATGGAETGQSRHFAPRKSDPFGSHITAPPQLVRNPKVQPDEWELDVIQTRLMSSSWPKDQSYTAMAAKSGVQAQRTLIPEYYGPSCLTCHGSPQGEIDITGFPKETSPASRKRAPAKATSAASSASRCTDEPGAALVDRDFLALRYDL